MFGGEGVACPAMADLDHVVMRIEMHRLAGPGAMAAGDEVPARKFRAIAGGAMGADQFAGESPGGEPGFEIFADIAVMPARRIQGRDADQILREADQIIAAGQNGIGQGIHAGRLARARGTVQRDRRRPIPAARIPPGIKARSAAGQRPPAVGRRPLSLCGDVGCAAVLRGAAEGAAPISAGPPSFGA